MTGRCFGRRAGARLLLGVLLLGVVAVAAPVPDGFVKAASGHEFFRFSVNQTDWGGAPDQSRLNHPLGPADRIFVKAGHFFTVGPDGVANTADDARIRLFGVNLSFGANFPAEKEAAAYARQLRRLGFNAVRLHHMDFHLDDDLTGNPQGVLTSGPYPTFNATAIRRLRTFIGALSQQGIYVDLNLHVSYRFRPAVDGLPALDHGDQISNGTLPIHVYYPALVQKQAQYASGLIKALGLTDNPALALVEINNESSLLDAWQSEPWNSQNWPDAIPSGYAAQLEKQWHSWVVRRYGSVQAACKMWDRCGDPAVMALPAKTLFGGDSNDPTLGERLARRLGDAVRALRGPPDPSAALSPGIRYDRDFLTFLMETDRRYFDRMKAVVRRATVGKVPVTGTQMTYGGVLNFDSQAHMDYIDNHVYIGHPVYAGGSSWQSVDWRVPDTSTSGGGIDRLLALSLRRDSKKPFVVSEFNQPFPSRRGSEILPLMAAVASMQDWDGLFFYDYSDDQKLKQAPGGFDLSGNWGQYALTGQSAAIFRKALIPPLKARVQLPLTQRERYLLAMQGDIDSGTLEKNLQAVYGVSARIAWTSQIAEDVLTDHESPAALPALSEPRASQTPLGTVRHDASRRQVTLDTNAVWGYFGGLKAGETVSGKFFRLRTRASVPQSVQILATPLDGSEMSRSRRFLVSVGGFTTGTQPGSTPARPQQIVPYPGKSGWLTLEPGPGSDAPSGLRDTQPPAWVERTDVELRIPYSVDDVTVYALDGAGRRAVRLDASALHPAVGDRPGTWVQLQHSVRTSSLWYEVVVS